jgi:hypothetical protein
MHENRISLVSPGKVIFQSDNPYLGPICPLFSYSNCFQDFAGVHMVKLYRSYFKQGSYARKINICA